MACRWQQQQQQQGVRYQRSVGERHGVYLFFKGSGASALSFLPFSFLPLTSSNNGFGQVHTLYKYIALFLTACIHPHPPAPYSQSHRQGESFLAFRFRLDCTLGKSLGGRGGGRNMEVEKKHKKGAEKITFVFSTPCLLFCICTYVLSIFYLGPLFFPDNTKHSPGLPKMTDVFFISP